MIEVLVVIGIIVVLGSFFFLVQNPAKEKGRDAQRWSDMGQIYSAMENCYDHWDCGGFKKYPSISSGARAITTVDTDGDPLLLNVPCDPLDEQCITGITGSYVYKWVSNVPAHGKQYYCVYTKLEAKADTWLCASNEGIAEKIYYTETPTIWRDDCCGMDLD